MHGLLSQPGSHILAFLLFTPLTMELSSHPPSGPEFEKLKISHSSTTSLHPQYNRMIECFHRSFKSSLLARLAGQDWVQHLPLVLLGLRTTPQEDSGYALAKVLFSTQLYWRILRCSRAASDGFSPQDPLRHQRILQTCSSSHPSCSCQTPTQDIIKLGICICA